MNISSFKILILRRKHKKTFDPEKEDFLNKHTWCEQQALFYTR